MRQRNRARFLMALLATTSVMTLLAAKRADRAEPIEHAQKNRPEPIRVQVTPRLGMSPLAVTVRVSIPDPGAEGWTCPEVTIRWPDGTESKAQPDCDPEDPTFDPFVRTRLFGVGNWEVEVRVKQGVNERVFRQTVQVIG